MIDPSLDRAATPPDRAAIAAAADALGTLPPIRYAPPHVYSVCAPAFEAAPRLDRSRRAAGPLRLYVHVPFCNYHCSYCFYAVKVGSGDAAMERYVEAVVEELRWIDAGAPLDQVFVGGGTPTALPPRLVDRLLGAVFERGARLPGVVHTLEASPESVTPEHLDVIAAHGVERVSMGIQSLANGILESVTRGHSQRSALEACRMIIERGLILNVDLIYGLPGQTEGSFRRDVEVLADAGVASFTFYDLRVNEATPVVRVLDDADRLSIARLARWRFFVREVARSLGYTQVRWHTYKRLDGVGRRHDRRPTFTDDAEGHQLGVGLSARSHLGFEIYRNHRGFDAYVERIEAGESPVEEVMRLRPADRRALAVARSLGDGKPLARAEWERAFGRPLEADYGPVLERLGAAGLIVDDGVEVRLGELGRLLHDHVTLAFYPDDRLDWLRDRAVERPIAPARVAT